MAVLCSCGTESKYCCPACKVRTCSLKCINDHKSKTQCTGVADKTKYVKLSEFDNMTLVSDYKFLENIKEVIDNSRREEESVRFTKSAKIGGLFYRKCIENNTCLKRMPGTFSRHTRNESNIKNNSINWSVELVFKERSKKVLTHGVSEEQTITAITGKLQTCLEYKFILSFFKECEAPFYFIETHVKDQPNTFYKIDPNSSLKDVLKYKTVVEYPTIYISSSEEMFKTIECEEFDVREELKKCGILPERKRKRNNRKGWKRRENNKMRKGEASAEKNVENVEQNVEKSNPFKDSVLKLFAE